MKDFIQTDESGDYIDMMDFDRPIGRHPVRMAELIRRDEKFIDLYNTVLNVTRVNPDKAWIIYQLTKNLVPGCIIEIGIYHGGSARFLVEMLPARNYHGYDTFAGVPPVTCDKDDERVGGQFADPDLKSVRDFIKHDERVLLYKGVFPSTFIEPAEPIALVHLDVDTYTGVMAGLNLFYERMTKDGLMVLDDYRSCFKGVTEAVDEFMSDKPENIMQFVINQAVFFKA